MADKRSRSVFVGNIPYDATEQQLIEVFSSVGPVASFRLVSDRETGKPKGFGFCEFRDQETAKSAIRNLDNYDFHGRSLRVRFADDTQTDSRGSALAQAHSQAVDEIDALIRSLTPQQQLDILTDMKRLVQHNREKARQLLIEQPQLAQAVLQIQVQNGLVRSGDIQSLHHQQAPSMPQPRSDAAMGPPGALPMGMPPAPVHYAPPPPPPPPPPGPMHHQLPPAPLPPHAGAPVHPGYAAAMAPAAMALPAAPASGAAPQLTDDIQQKLQRVMSMTPEQIAALPQEAQQQIHALRARLRAGYPQ